MAWQLLAAALPAAAKVAGTALSKPREEDYKPQTDYMKKYLSYLRGRTADREVAHLAMQPALRVAGKQGRQMQRQVGYDVARAGLEGSGIEAQMRLSAGQQTQDALATATDKAVAAQAAETARVGEKAAGITAQIQAEEARADQAFKTAESQWKRQLASDVIGGVASVASAGITQAGQLNEAKLLAERAGYFGGAEDVQKMIDQGWTPQMLQQETARVDQRVNTLLGSGAELSDIHAELGLGAGYTGAVSSIEPSVEQLATAERGAMATAGMNVDSVTSNNAIVDNVETDPATTTTVTTDPVKTDPATKVETEAAQEKHKDKHKDKQLTEPVETKVEPTVEKPKVKTKKELLKEEALSLGLDENATRKDINRVKYRKKEQERIDREKREKSEAATQRLIKIRKKREEKRIEKKQLKETMAIYKKQEARAKTEKVIAEGAKRAKYKNLINKPMKIKRDGKDYNIVVKDIDLENNKVSFIDMAANKKRTTSLEKFDKYRGVTNMASKGSEKKYNVSDNILDAIRETETGGATEETLLESQEREGAIGAYQQRDIFYEEVTKNMGFPEYDRNNPNEARKAAKHYIEYLVNNKGLTEKEAVAAYNAGVQGGKKGYGDKYTEAVYSKIKGKVS